MATRAPSRSATSARARSCAGCASRHPSSRWRSRPTARCSRCSTSAWRPSRRSRSASCARTHACTSRRSPGVRRILRSRATAVSSSPRRPRPSSPGTPARASSGCGSPLRTEPTAFALSPDSRVVAAGSPRRPGPAVGPAHGQATRRRDQGRGVRHLPARHLAGRPPARRRRGGRHGGGLGPAHTDAPRTIVHGPEGHRPERGVRARRSADRRRAPERHRMAARPPHAATLRLSDRRARHHPRKSGRTCSQTSLTSGFAASAEASCFDQVLVTNGARRRMSERLGRRPPAVCEGWRAGRASARKAQVAVRPRPVRVPKFDGNAHLDGAVASPAGDSETRFAAAGLPRDDSASPQNGSVEVPDSDVRVLFDLVRQPPTNPPISQPGGTSSAEASALRGAGADPLTSYDVPS